MYKLLRVILFNFHPEKVHYFSMNLLQRICQVGMLRKAVRKSFQPKKQSPVSHFGISFPNRIGLAAGFDKNAQYLLALQCLGFGFVEIGTVTPLPQVGNPGPRLFRLPADKALINRMGFNNDGAEKISRTLRKWREEEQKWGGEKLIVGGNIGKNKNTPNDLAWKDYEICFKALHDCVDYFVVNVSSPNTPGLRALQEKDALRKILTHLHNINKTMTVTKPILLKIAPDLSMAQVDDVIALALEIQLDGLVVSNTTLDRSGLSKSSTRAADAAGAGGLSGLPVKNKSTSLIAYMYNKLGDKIPIIGSGGVFSGSDMQEKVGAGAVLVQVWTGFVYEGPGIVKKVLQAEK